MICEYMADIDQGYEQWRLDSVNFRIALICFKIQIWW